jgi:trk system potassium uptake protein TrkH
MIPALVISMTRGEDSSMNAFAVTIGFFAFVGLLLVLLRRRSDVKTMYAKEGFLVVGLSWILLSVIGAMPFYFSGCVSSFVDAIFESISGFTTTGASIFSDVEALPQGILYWRSFSQWMGGIGVLMFLLAISSSTSGRSVYLMRAEFPGPSMGKLKPRLKDTAKVLCFIYLSLTALETILLAVGGMPLFDSILHSFGTAATGGFAIKNASVAFYNNAYFEAVIAVFMILFGINLNVFYLVILRRFTGVYRNEELRYYLITIVAAIPIVMVDLIVSGVNVLTSFRLASFQVAATLSTTAYTTSNFNLWPKLSQVVLVLLMFVGACGGSTSGGIKIARIVIMLKDTRRRIKRMIHPNSTQIVQMNGQPVNGESVSRVYAFFFVYFLILSASALLISLDNLDLVSSVTAVIASLNNVGPGLGSVGPDGSYSVFSDFSKILLSVDMLLGRLEIFPIIMVFSPSVWRNR